MSKPISKTTFDTNALSDNMIGLFYKNVVKEISFPVDRFPGFIAGENHFSFLAFAAKKIELP